MTSKKSSPRSSQYSAGLKAQFEENDANYIRFGLPKLQAASFACILEEAIDQLIILGKIGATPNVQAKLGYKSLEERFGKDVPELQIFDPETIEPYRDYIKRQRFIKFQEDRSYVEKILKETMDDLVEHDSYYSLIKRIEEHEREVFEENLLLEEANKLRQELDRINFTLGSEKLTARSDFVTISDTILKLKEKYEDIIFDNLVTTNYINDWEDARKEQNNMTLDQKEGFYLKQIRDSETNIDREIRINAEIESFIREIHKDHEDAIEQWMERYDAEVEQRDTEIQVLKEKREDQFDYLKKLSELYEIRKVEVEEYLKIVEQRRLEAELRAYQTIYAIKIQAWWRGTMYRKKLGPYRVRKGKDKGKGKKKKK